MPKERNWNNLIIVEIFFFITSLPAASKLSANRRVNSTLSCYKGTPGLHEEWLMCFNDTVQHRPIRTMCWERSPLDWSLDSGPTLSLQRLFCPGLGLGWVVCVCGGDLAV